MILELPQRSAVLWMPHPSEHNLVVYSFPETAGEERGGAEKERKKEKYNFISEM